MLTKMFKVLLTGQYERARYLSDVVIMSMFERAQFKLDVDSCGKLRNEGQIIE